jgi:HPt (histidine-containing phosphotransfer) domain-containing protein
MTEPPKRSEAEDKTAALLATLWLKVRPIVEERLATLDQAAAAAEAGTLPDAQRQEAGVAAHKLAGALGMYGYDDGTDAARQLELLLAEPNPAAARLVELTAALRKAVFPSA